jgi:hypothetical protein
MSKKEKTRGHAKWWRKVIIGELLFIGLNILPAMLGQEEQWQERIIFLDTGVVCTGLLLYASMWITKWNLWFYWGGEEDLRMFILTCIMIPAVILAYLGMGTRAGVPAVTKWAVTLSLLVAGLTGPLRLLTKVLWRRSSSKKELTEACVVGGFFVIWGIVVIFVM